MFKKSMQTIIKKEECALYMREKNTGCNIYGLNINVQFAVVAKITETFLKIFIFVSLMVHSIFSLRNIIKVSTNKTII